MPNIRLMLGKCEERLKELEDNSVDSVVCDPPYELGIIGKSWDSTGIAYNIEMWKEVLRVLKPGGHLLAFGGCYDEKTDVLTHRGWINFKDVKYDDVFASLNPKTHIVEWLPCTEIVQFEHDGDMHHFKTNKIDLLVTPNHKMFISYLGKHHAYKLVRADEVKNAVKMTKTSCGREDTIDTNIFVLPAVDQSNGHYINKIPEKIIPLDAWLPFFGLWIAEGSASIIKGKTGNGYRVQLSHFNIDNLKAIKSLLDPYLSVIIYEKLGILIINNKQLCEYLQQFGYANDKFVPSYIKQLHKKYIQLFIEWYARGDGDKEGRIYTCSKLLCDDLQEVAMYAGWAVDISMRKPRRKSSIHGREIKSNHPQYVIRVCKSQIRPECYNRKTKKVNRSIIPKEKWDGNKVYCIELERNHTLYVRRNGKAVWCGNTRTYHRMACAVEDAGFEIRDQLQWIYLTGWPKSLDVGKVIDQQLGVKREILVRTGQRCGIFAQSGSGKPQDITKYEKTITAPATEEAKKWDGWGTALKPAVTPIVMARKTLSEKNIALNVMNQGTGALNINDTRIHGKWPSNVIFSEDILPDEELLKTFFFVPKASTYEKEHNLIGDKKIAGGYQGREDGSLGSITKRINSHNTIKSIELMEYLIKLVTPPEGIVLDPFLGSGSTGLAALNNMFSFIGIEMMPDYFEIAVQRIKGSPNAMFAEFEVS